MTSDSETGTVPLFVAPKDPFSDLSPRKATFNL